MPSPLDSKTVVNNLSDLDDAELLGLYVRGGEPEYLAELVERYHGLVASIVRRNSKDEHDIQDGVQATFLILVKSAAKIRRRESLAAWLHGVAHRTARRIRERSQRERAMQYTANSNDELVVDQLLADDESPLTIVTKKIQLDVLDEELQCVRELYRSVLVEHYLLGKTAAEIGQNCNLSQSTVEGRLRRGRQQLRMRMLRRGFGFSAAVAISGEFISAQQASAAEIEPIVEQLVCYSDGPSVDIPSSVSNLIVEEITMSSFLTTKLSLTLLMGSLSAGVLALLLAMPAVGEQTGKGPVTNIATESRSTEPAASVVAPSGIRPAQAGSTVPAVSTPPFEATPAHAWPAVAAGRVQQTLRNQLPNVSFNGIPLQQVLVSISDDTRTPIRIDWAALEEQGISQDEPVTLEMPPIPLSQVLDYILRPMALSYRVEGDVLHVSTREKLDQRPSLRVYDLSVFERPGIATLIEKEIHKIQPECWSQELWSVNVLDENFLLVSVSDPAQAEIEMMLTDLARQLGKPLPQSVVKKSATPRPNRSAPIDNPFADKPAGNSSDPFGGSNATSNSNNPFGN